MNASFIIQIQDHYVTFVIIAVNILILKEMLHVIPKKSVWNMEWKENVFADIVSFFVNILNLNVFRVLAGAI